MKNVRFFLPFLLTLFYGSVGVADIITPVPDYPISGRDLILQLSGSSGGSPYEPSDIRWDIDGHEITIRADLPSMGFAVPGAYEEPVVIGQLDPGTYRARYIGYFSLSEDPELLDEIVFTVAEPHPTIPVHSLFHPERDHYFLTQSQHKRDRALERGWLYADEGFNAWPASGPAPRDAEPVCHFYAAQPNSHFYTADQAECESLQGAPGLRYLGVAFQALTPTAAMCPGGTTPVWRLYNNGYQEGDSNHRFVTDTETYRTLMGADWSGEGIAFCAPPASAAGAG